MSPTSPKRSVTATREDPTLVATSTELASSSRHSSSPLPSIAGEDLLADVIDRYVGSGDFDGFFIRAGDPTGVAAKALIRQDSPPAGAGAGDLVEFCEQRLGLLVHEPVTPLHEHALSACRALLAEAAGDNEQAAKLYAEAAGRWQRLGNVPELRAPRLRPLPRGARQGARGGAAARGARSVRLDGVPARPSRNGRVAGACDRGRLLTSRQPSIERSRIHVARK